MFIGFELSLSNILNIPSGVPTNIVKTTSSNNPHQASGHLHDPIVSQQELSASIPIIDGGLPDPIIPHQGPSGPHHGHGGHAQGPSGPQHESSGSHQGTDRSPYKPSGQIEQTSTTPSFSAEQYAGSSAMSSSPSNPQSSSLNPELSQATLENLTGDLSTRESTTISEPKTTTNTINLSTSKSMKTDSSQEIPVSTTNKISTNKPLIQTLSKGVITTDNYSNYTGKKFFLHFSTLNEKENLHILKIILFIIPFF